MPTRHVLTVHGWSARDTSMGKLAGFLGGQGFAVEHVWLGGYPSMADEVHLADSARRLGQLVAEMQADGRLGPRFHVITHSTGALVVRQWLAFEHAGGGAPVDNLVMLAPANFGSPLAVMGRSALGRLIKGFGNSFQTGTEFLHALEHGSALQERLALSDRLSREGDRKSVFSEAGTRPYVITGLDVFRPMGILGESAWDGTVRAASAHIDPQGVTVDFSQRGDDGLPWRRLWTRRGPDSTAFAVLPDRHHLNITEPSERGDTGAGRLGRMILQALRTDDAKGYRQVRDDWRAVNAATRTLVQPDAEARRASLDSEEDMAPDTFNEHYQIVFSVRDDTGLPVNDYFVWLTTPTENELASGLGASVSRPEEYALRHVLKKVHVNRRDASRRVFHIDRRELMKQGGLKSAMTPARLPLLAAGLSAPAPGRLISYFERGDAMGSGLIPLRSLTGDGEQFLKRYATHFIEVIVPRRPDESVFTVRASR
ncbi:esterase/lipase family protein [Glycocaulis sp.]|uniref:esterase/lipase family protein n=1 Tax=Glycocaulis sp. TaxID=1969725 RepID=UPI003F6E6DB1